LVANTIPDAIRLVGDETLKIDAVVADIFFEGPKQDAENRLFDGIDLLSFLGKRKFSAPMFVISASHEMLDYRGKADELGVPVINFYDKLTAADVERPAWIDIQRSVLARTFGTESEITTSISALPSGNPDAIDMMNETLCRLQLPVRTYIQDLGKNKSFGVGRPIEVICVARGPSSVHAYATILGLPAQGRGEDIQSAVDDLRDLIALEAETLLGTDPSRLTDYTSRVVQRLSQYVSILD
jgi:hypothetical protein